MPININPQGVNATPTKYCNKVKNTSPSFTVPAAHTKRLAFIRDLVDKCDHVNVVKSDVAMYMRPTMQRTKAFYPDREKAIRALTKVFCEHVNLVTHQVKITLVQAAALTGLDTVSEAETVKAKLNPNYTPNKNISRVSRAFKSMIDLGWIVAPREWQKWDKHSGQWLDKYFEVTDLFFTALGITKERVEKHRTARLKYLCSKDKAFGLSAEELGEMSISEIKTRQRIAHYRSALERVRTKRATSKIKRSMSNKTAQEQRSVAQEAVIRKLGDDIETVTFNSFKDLINIELAQLRSISGITKPT